ncbi:MAG: hypothetical protein K0U63_06985 [Cyanobacteria bacterium]|nr:hypothetical protein [Cyanobacteriota bacterium]
MARILVIHWQPSLLALALALVAGGCAEEPLPEQGIRRGDCLRDLSLVNLEERLQECHGVVKAFPTDPAPLNDRYLLHSLLGNDQAACGDLRQAVELARAIPASQLDEQLRTDLQVREQLCKAGEPNSPVAQ